MEYMLSKFLDHGLLRKKKKKRPGGGVCRDVKVKWHAFLYFGCYEWSKKRKKDGTNIEHRQKFGMDTHLSKI